MTLEEMEKNMFGKAMQIENNVATIQHDAEDYHITVTVERRSASAISQEDAETVLTRVMPLLFTQRIRLGSSSRQGKRIAN